MKRKIFAALIAVMMVVTMLPLSVMAAEPVTTETALRDAVKAGGTVILGADIELTNTYMKVAADVTIDLNGYTISGNFESDYGTVYVGASGKLTIKDSSTAGTGAITSTETHAIGNFGVVKIHGGSFTGCGERGGYQYGALYNFYFDNSTNGFADIYGGTFDAILNCGEVNVSDANIEVLDNSGVLILYGGNVINTLIDKDGDDAFGEGSSVIVFTGNIDNPNVVKNAEDETGESVDVYEKYDAPKIAVRFDLNGGTGTVPTDMFVTPGKTYGTLPTVTKEGYKFVGWHLAYETYIQVNSLLRGIAAAAEGAEELEYDGVENDIITEDSVVWLEHENIFYSNAETAFHSYIILVAEWEEVEEEIKPEPKPEKPEPKFDMPKLNLRSIVIDTTEGGKTNVASGRCYGALGSTHRLALTPDEGYEIGEVLVNGKPVEVSKKGNISFVVKGNTYVEVEFVEIED